MTESEMLALARREGFEAGIVETGEIEFDPRFGLFVRKISAASTARTIPVRRTAARRRDARAHRALSAGAGVPQRVAIADYQDQEAIRLAKREHNGGMLRAIDQMRAAGIEGTMRARATARWRALQDPRQCALPLPGTALFLHVGVLRVRAQACRALRHGVRRGRRHRLLRAVCLRARRGFRTHLRPPAAPRSLPRAFALSTDALRNFDSAALSSGAMRDAVVRFALSADARRPLPRPPRA